MSEILIVYPLVKILGWIAAFLFIIAYLFLALGKLKSDGITYHLLNVFGALGLIINAFNFVDYANVIVNGVWMVIGLYAIIGIYMRNRKII
ncbi:CBU_0592 family membrane protein [Solitalea lacus]|uniref:CBU_0592 family membrane protein n=1 Tax=Solitalea lacus TaxID=2911172 RepID=UPI001EDC0698|nr:hypothetical protein [Solitalea lacus]UKJ06820.1 hypothetical protein L2B55_14935 [Solitalea lacus]